MLPPSVSKLSTFIHHLRGVRLALNKRQWPQIITWMVQVRDGEKNCTKVMVARNRTLSNVFGGFQDLNLMNLWLTQSTAGDNCIRSRRSD